MIIAIYACLATWCSTHSLVVPAEQITLHACGRSQMHVVRWSWDNPGWQVNRWDCKRIEIAGIGK